MKSALDSAIHRFKAKTSHYTPEVWWDLYKLGCRVKWHQKPGELIDVTSVSDHFRRTIQGPSRVYIELKFRLDDPETQLFALALREAFMSLKPMNLKWHNPNANVTVLMKAMFTAFVMDMPSYGPPALECMAEVTPIEFQS